MKIVSLTAENIKRLKAVEIKPDGNLVIIGGRNGQGKSSVLDAIECALGGRDRAPAVPIRRGETKASVVLDLDDLIVERTFNEAGNSYLSVKTKEGNKYSSPQAILDKLVGSLSFDPLEFSRMDPKGQLQTLKALVGLDFSELDEKRAEIFQERSVVNKQVKDFQSVLANLPEHQDVPETEVSAQDLLAEMDRLNRINQQNERERADLEKMRVDHRMRQERYEALNRKIKDLQDELEDLCAQSEAMKREIQEAKEEGKAAAARIDNLKDEDLTDIRDQIRNADAINSKVRGNRERAKLERRLEEASARAEALTRSLEEIDSQKGEMLAKAVFPIPGMSFDENGVLLNGLPFSQASSAEQLRASVAMGLALNPKLKVLLVRDGSLLDADSLRMVAEMAAAGDGQVWVEKVSEGEEVGVIIEDGLVKGANLKEAVNQ